MLIDSFSGKYAFLSNFSKTRVSVFGFEFPTAEHAFQAAKSTKIADLQAILVCGTPTLARRYGRKVELRPNWEEIKVDVMRQVLAAKFALGSELAKKLIKTGGAHLVEGNKHGDEFWGCVTSAQGNTPWQGMNQLGILLMERRTELARADEPCECDGQRDGEPQGCPNN